MMYFRALLLIFFTLCKRAYFKKSDDKRLLINDPNLINQRIDDVTQRLSAMETVIQTLQTENLNLRNTVQSIEKTNRDLNTSVTDLKTSNTKLNRTVELLQNVAHSLASSYGIMYVRWGRTGCPSNDTELVYTGYTGGQKSRIGGGVATTICLPSDPTWGKQHLPPPNNFVEIEGSEYETDFFGQGTLNEDIPCAVCRKKSRTSVIMIPARTSCYAGLTMEYRGYLAGGSYNSPSDYICIDENPDVMTGGDVNDDSGRLFYPIKVFCGPLPCPPYHDRMLASCVVCTK